MKDSTTTAHPIVAPKKLIEVALPLDEINKASAREKSIRHGHPSTLHLWWARRPLAAARAVLFAQMVNDPSWKYSEEELKKPQIKSAITRKRNELFKLITDLVQWENTNNEEVLSKARAAIRESWRETCEANKKHPEAKTLFNPDTLPPLHDPFAGGGSIPLEAQRLGLEAHATDLNPVAVLINKAMIEIPPKFAGRPPVGPIPPGEKQTKAKGTEDWAGARGLAEDVRRYGAWMREEAWKRVGHLYPKVNITKEIVKERPDLQKYEGRDLTVIAWIWARTVPSPNPAARRALTPLVASFQLSSKKDRPTWVKTVVDSTKLTFHFQIQVGTKDEHPEVDSTVNRTGGICLFTGAPIPFKYIREQARAGNMSSRLMAVVLDGNGQRLYVAPNPKIEAIALSASPGSPPSTSLPDEALGFRVQEYGLTRHADLFSSRQLTVLSTLCGLVGEAQRDIASRLEEAGAPDDGRRLSSGGVQATGYADAVALYLALAVSRYANAASTLCTWNPGEKKEDIRFTFSRQALSMSWDFAEGNPFSDSSGNFSDSAGLWIYKSLRDLGIGPNGLAYQQDAACASMPINSVISTDPPYYDNIGYADLSDYFYIWLRRGLSSIEPALFQTILVPKTEELIASPHRHGGRAASESFFLDGMLRAMQSIATRLHPTFPVSIYYAFKQSETSEEVGTASTGWETFLGAVVRAGFLIAGTWPTRSERGGRMRDIGSNALASSIVLVCRRRASDAGTVSRREFARQLEVGMPSALSDMTADPIASIAPVDLAQAAIGPGMAIFSKYKAVLEADGSPMSVHSALIHINKAIDDYFAQAEGDMDADTRFCIGWFQQYEYEVGPFGQADVLARAKGTSVEGVRDAGVLHASKGEVRLLRVKEYPASWDPTKDSRLPIWEACHQMCRALGESETEAGALLARMPDKQDAIRQLAYRLYTICERKGWAEDARAYNELVTSWPAIVEESLKAGHKGSQMSLL